MTEMNPGQSIWLRREFIEKVLVSLNTEIKSHNPELHTKLKSSQTLSNIDLEGQECIGEMPTNPVI